MCGRYSLFTPPDGIESRFDATLDYPFEPRYNAAPGQRLPVITGAKPDTVERLEWGLVPSWAEDPSDFGFVNARAETVAEKPSFEASFERRRCLVLADGFYEWAGDRPYRVTLEDEAPFAMAGIWDRWTPPTAQTGLDEFRGDGSVPDPTPVETFAVVTTQPNDLVADLHHRMSVILAPDEEAPWLHGNPEEAAGLLDPYPADGMRAYPVSTAVNDPSNDCPAVVEEIAPGN